jgi:hypothetical protein
MAMLSRVDAETVTLSGVWPASAGDDNPGKSFNTESRGLQRIRVSPIVRPRVRPAHTGHPAELDGLAVIAAPAASHPRRDNNSVTP